MKDQILNMLKSKVAKIIYTVLAGLLTILGGYLGVEEINYDLNSSVKIGGEDNATKILDEIIKDQLKSKKEGNGSE